MARLTHDAIAVQAILTPGDNFPLHAIAFHAFSPDAEKATPVAIMRAKRACQILKERGSVEIVTGIGEGLVVRLAAEVGSGAQLQALMSRSLFSIERDEEDSAPE